MASYFYLSCSVADNSKLLKEFFENLSTAVRSWLQLSADEEVGFFDASTDGQGRRPEQDEALRTSQTMIAMVSPDYFQSADVSQERQIFDIRKRSIEKSGHNPSPIIPVIWIPCQDSTPGIFEREQYEWGASFKAYQLNGLMNLMELRASLPSLGDSYRQVLVALAKQIIDRTRTMQLPALKFQVAIVDNDQFVGEMLTQYLSAVGYECRLWQKAESALSEILEADVFDVVLVDLELDLQETQGLALIERLAAQDNSPPVIAMATGLSNSESIEALKTGAIDVIPKPFDPLQLEMRIGNVARIGQGRRLYRQNSKRKLLSRERPVFLSYSNIDRRTAKILKTQLEVRGIGVWYAPDNLAPGNWLIKDISDGLDEAQVFVALVTDNYARSPWCVFELTTYQRKPKKLVIPVLEGHVHRMRNSQLIRDVTKCFVCDITFDRFADGLTLLLGKIQLVINGKT